MSRMIPVFLVGLAAFFLLTNCTPNPAIPPSSPVVNPSESPPVGSPTIPNGGLPTPIATQNTPGELEVYPQAVWAAVQDLALRLGINPDQVQVISFHEEEWPDSCLGLAAADEMCLQVITPGYRVLLGASGMRYEYHTDESGGVLRVIGDTVLEPIKPGLDLDKPKAILAAMQALNLSTATPFDEMQVASIEAVQWPDSCLGLAGSVELCAEVITPGWNILLEANGQSYEFHTDQSGENVRMK